MTPAFRQFHAGLFDYAGLFPPARLPLAEAAAKYFAYRESADAWMLGRFICPVGQLADFGTLIPGNLKPASVSVLGRGGAEPEGWLKAFADDLAACAAWNAVQAGRGAADAFEVRLPDALDASEAPAFFAAASKLADAALPSAPVYLEIPAARDWAPLARALAHAWPGAGLKLRCGGTEALAFPSAEQILAAILAAVRAGRTLKFTAGLHHPIRHWDAGLSVWMHGFLNVVGAAVSAALHPAANEDHLLAILLATEASGFTFDGGSAGFLGFHADTEELAAARSRILSLGSCSFDEPREDLRKLHFHS